MPSVVPDLRTSLNEIEKCRAHPRSLLRTPFPRCSEDTQVSAAPTPSCRHVIAGRGSGGGELSGETKYFLKELLDVLVWSMLLVKQHKNGFFL